MNIPTESEVRQILRSGIHKYINLPVVPVLAAFYGNAPSGRFALIDRPLYHKLKIWWALLGTDRTFTVYRFPNIEYARMAVDQEDVLPYHGEMILEYNVDRLDAPYFRDLGTGLAWHKVPRNWRDNFDPSRIRTLPIQRKAHTWEQKHGKQKGPVR